MHKGLLFCAVILIVAAAGCIAASQLPAATPPQTSFTAATPGTTVPATTSVLTTARTTAPAPTATAPTAAPSKPLAETVTLKGTGPSSGSFTVVAPGKIIIDAAYGNSLTPSVTGCSAAPYRVTLTGKSIDFTLLSGLATTRKNSNKVTFNIITPGQYKIVSSGCYGWQAVITNA